MTPIPGEPEPDAPGESPDQGDLGPEMPEQATPADPIHDPRIPMTKEPSRGV